MDLVSLEAVDQNFQPDTSPTPDLQNASAMEVSLCHMAKAAIASLLEAVQGDCGDVQLVAMHSEQEVPVEIEDLEPRWHYRPSQK